MRITVQDPIPTTFDTLIIPLAQYSGELAIAAVQAVADDTGMSPDAIRQCFRGNAGEVFPIFTGAQCRLLVGLGKAPHFGNILKVFRQLAQKQSQQLQAQVAISWLHGNTPKEVVEWSEAAVNGLFQGTYQIGRYKTEQGKTHPFDQEDGTLKIVAPQEHHTAIEAAIQRGQLIARTQKRIMALVNAPSNFKRPQHLAQWATEAGKESGFSVKIWDKKRIEKENMDALLAVNRGSEDPPVFIIMEYKGPKKGHQPKIGLVGKGVTFDTGGLSIKPSTNMHYMKSDMGGAAAVMGTMEVAARLQLPIHLIGVVPATDNSVDALAVKPGEVIGSYSGKSIEIIDTDAEGRLILADGLSYMVRQHNPHILIDLATLTGSSVRTFGYQAAALFSNDDQLATHLYEAGMQSQERVWRLPIWKEYGEEMKSDMADIKNFSGRPMSGAITAAKFLEFFTDEHPSWAHLDIAGVAFGDSDFATGKAATGYGVRLLITFLQSIIA